jgi:hypothetical protein
MTIRCTIKCPKLSQFPAKGISPDDMKIMSESTIISQTKINNNYNNRAIQLGDILISKLKDCDITWCNDGCVVISCSDTLTKVSKVFAEEGLEIQPDRSEIKHKIKKIDDDTQEQDIDEVFEPESENSKKIKSRKIENQFKLKS